MFGLAIDLARISSRSPCSFHIIFPAITIGLASYLAVLEGLWLKTNEEVYRDLYHFWSKIFAVNFGMGVVSGLVMAYQFGTNWSHSLRLRRVHHRSAADLRGAHRVLPRGRFPRCHAVRLEPRGTEPAFLRHGDGGDRHADLDVLDPRFQQLDADPAGLRDRRRPGDPGGLGGGDLQPVVPLPPAAHVGAAFLATAFFVGASAAWHLLRGARQPGDPQDALDGHVDGADRRPVQALIGDAHGLNTLEHQPAKIAAMEGHWDNSSGEPTPLILFGWPDMQREETRFKVEIPVLGSLILKHSLTEPIPALKDFPPEDRPNSTVVFWSFRIMAGLGMLMILVGVWSLWLRWRGQDKLFNLEGLPAPDPADGTVRPDRDPRRLVHHRDGPPALGGLRTDAHRRRLLGAERDADEPDPADLRGGVLLAVRRRYRLHDAPGAQGPVTHEGRETNPGGAGQKRTPARLLSAAGEGFDEEHDGHAQAADRDQDKRN